MVGGTSFLKKERIVLPWKWHIETRTHRASDSTDVVVHVDYIFEKT